MRLFLPDPVQIPLGGKWGSHLLQSSGILLEDLWPEPDWFKLSRTVRVEALAAIAMVRAGLAQQSKPDQTFDISANEWKESFIRTVPKVEKQLMLSLSAHEAFDLNQRLASVLKTTVLEIRTTNIEAHLDFWSVGRGISRPISPGSISLQQRVLAKWLPYMGWPANDMALYSSIVPHRLDSGDWGVVRVRGNQFVAVTEEIFEKEAHALAVAISITGRENRLEDTLSDGMSAKLVRRVGPSQRLIAAPTPDYLVHTFGFRDIQFGPAVTKREQNEWCGHLVDAFADLADVTGMPRHWIGLGRLVLAIGTRANPASDVDFDVRANVMHLSRACVAGNIAAKWWLALDARMARTTLKRQGFISCNAHSPSLFEDFPTRILNVVQQIALIREYLLPHSDYFLRSRHRNQLNGRDTGLERIEQMLARVFQTFVQDELLMQNRLSPWLAFGTLPSDAMSGMPFEYPLGEERSNLHQLMATLVLMLLQGD